MLKKLMRKLITFSLCIGVIVVLANSIVKETQKLQRPSSHALISPILGVKTLGTTVKAEEASTKPEDEPFYNLLKNNIEKGEFGIYVLKPSNNEVHSYNKGMIFPAASLYKLTVIAAAYDQMEHGLLTPETVMSMSKSRLSAIFGDVDYGYEDAGGTISMTVEDALSRIARHSDNFAAILLSETIRENAAKAPKKEVVQPWWEALLGVQQQQEEPKEALLAMAQSLGLKNTTFEPPQTTPEDMGRFFELLYKGEVVSTESSEKIINLLATAQINNRIPALLPKESTLKIAHKTGELSGLRHDAGIVLVNNPTKDTVERHADDYVVVLMSKDLVFEDTGIDNLAQMSRKIYDLMVPKK
jgi:beta-lactamase class A